MSSKRALPVLSILALLPFGLGACGGDDSSDSGGADSGGSEIAAPGSAAAVCDGEANGSAPEYAEGSAQVAVYVNGGDGYEFTSYSTDLGDDASALIPEEASVIVCMDVTDSEVVDSCEFQDDDSGEKFTEELADATYDVRVLVAQTGEELTSETLSAEAGDCGIIASFEPGEGSRIEYARAGDDLKKLLKPYTG